MDPSPADRQLPPFDPSGSVACKEIDKQAVLKEYLSSKTVTQMEPRNWMASFQDRRLFSLAVPGTHNSTSCEQKHLSFFIKGFVACQKKPLARQLAEGIRAIDLRILKVRTIKPDGSSEDSFWTGHSARLAPLSSTLKDIKEFLDSEPSEFVFLNIAGEGSPLDDIRFMGWFRPNPKDRVVRERLDRPELLNVVVEQEIMNVLGSKVARFGELHPKSGQHLLREDVTLGELTSAGKQMLIYESFDGVYHQDRVIEQGERASDMKPIQILNSYWKTMDKTPAKNISKCKEWCSSISKGADPEGEKLVALLKDQPFKDRLAPCSTSQVLAENIILTEVKPEITWVNLTTGYVFKELVCNFRSGLSTHAKTTNRHFTEHLFNNLKAVHEENKADEVDRVNIVWYDFYTNEGAEAVIMSNLIRQN